MQGTTIPRTELLESIRKRLKLSPVVTLLGARQVGKTTLAETLAAESSPVSMFDLELASGRAALEAAPELTLRAESI